MNVTTTNLNVGDNVFADFSKYGRVNVARGEVIRKSATGVIAVRFTNGSVRSFKPNGMERDCTYLDAAVLIDEATYRRSIARQRIQVACRDAMDAVKVAAGVNIMPTNKAEMIAKLERAIEAVRAIPDAE